METTKVTFRWPYTNVTNVQLAGTFNSWDPTDMNMESEGWMLDLEVPVGHHEFKFVVDGDWVHDEGQKCVQNEMGSFNNVVEVNASSPNIADFAKTWPKIVKKAIEVERKFSVPENFHSILIWKKFQPVQEFQETLVDEYFDTREFDLLKNDHWLRLRNKDWELKYPVGNHSEGTTIYHECSVQDEILSRIASLGIKGLNLAEMTDQNIITRFALLETKRSCYKRDNVNIMIDDTDWGFRVGEVEVVVESEDHVPEATNTINNIAKELEFKRLDFVSEYMNLVEE